MSKPDREACLKMAKAYGATIDFNGPPIKMPLVAEDSLERLIHAAYDAGEKAAARECARLCERVELSRPYESKWNRHDANLLMGGWGDGTVDCSRAISAHFNLNHPAPGATHD